MDVSIIDEVKLFASRVVDLMPVKMIIWYGSTVNGAQRRDSDIDVAVVVDELTGNWLKVNSQLFLLSAEIDDRIEPNLIIAKDNKSGFLESIMQYGVVIYPETQAA